MYVAARGIAPRQGEAPLCPSHNCLHHDENGMRCTGDVERVQEQLLCCPCEITHSTRVAIVKKGDLVALCREIPHCQPLHLML